MDPIGIFCQHILQQRYTLRPERFIWSSCISSACYFAISSSNFSSCIRCLFCSRFSCLTLAFSLVWLRLTDESDWSLLRSSSSAKSSGNIEELLFEKISSCTTCMSSCCFCSITLSSNDNYWVLRLFLLNAMNLSRSIELPCVLSFCINDLASRVLKRMLLFQTTGCWLCSKGCTFSLASF